MGTLRFRTEPGAPCFTKFICLDKQKRPCEPMLHTVPPSFLSKLSFLGKHKTPLRGKAPHRSSVFLKGSSIVEKLNAPARQCPSPKPHAFKKGCLFGDKQTPPRGNAPHRSPLLYFKNAHLLLRKQMPHAGQFSEPELYAVSKTCLFEKQKSPHEAMPSIGDAC